MYVFGAVESLTKFMVAAPYTSKSAKNVVHFIETHIVYQFGVPMVITTDRGLEFHDKIGDALMESLSIRRIRTSRYSPRANGEIERRWR